jgi:3',5'-cyclic AMP phosphodiesterase CpdA
VTSPEPQPGSFVVRVLAPDGQPAGAGVLVSDRRVVTCAHVVNTALGREAGAQDRPGEDAEVMVDFPELAPGDPGGDRAARPGTLRARVVAWVPPPRENAAGDDVAGLELSGFAPTGTLPAKLGVETPRGGRTLRVFGCPPGEPGGAWATVAVKDRPGNGRLVLESQPGAGPRFQPGFDGGPLVDAELGRVVGVVCESVTVAGTARDGVAISAGRLRLAWPGQLAFARHRASGRGADGARGELTILHVSDPQFGKHHIFGGNGLTPADQAHDTLFARLHRDLAQLAQAAGRPVRPDLMVVTGDLAEWGLASEFTQVTAFLGALAEAAEIPRKHVAIVPGNHDISRKACAAYFADAEADEVEPVAPYWPKWRHYAKAFADFYADVPGATFTPDQPWTLFEMADLHVVVAGLNSTIAESHRDEDHYGWTGEHQLQWFATRLARYQARGWLRIAAVHHNAIRGAVLDDENLRDADDLDRVLGQPKLASLLLHGHTHDGQLHYLPSGLAVASTGSAAVHAAARPAEVPNQYQLITISRDGFTRHARSYARNQKRWIGDTRISASGSDWRDERPYPLTDVEATFPAPVTPPAAEIVDAEPEAGEPDGPRASRRLAQNAHGDRDVYMAGGNIYAHSIIMGAGGGGINFSHLLPKNWFLTRVAQATRVRFPDASVDEGRGGDCDYLRVSRSSDGGDRVDLWPVGVIDGPLDEVGLAAFSRVRAQFAAADPQVRSELVHTGPPAPATLVAQARQQGIRLRTFVEYQGLLDLSPLAGAQRQRLTNDRVYPAGLYVEQRFRVAEVAGPRLGETRTGLMEQAVSWLSEDDARLIVVLGDFGRGKTSFLRQLTRVLPAELPSVLPILVELRTLEKAPTLDELLAQHLVRNGVDDVSPKKLRYMIESGRLALLFDGFDELELRVGYDNAADYLRTLLDAVTGQAKVLLTSRTQHFRSTDQVRTELGATVEARSASRVVILEEFTKDQILAFLTNFYRGDAARAQARFALIGQIENLLALAANPRMLAFVAALETERLEAVRGRAGELTPAALYQEIIDYWLTFEVRKHLHRWGTEPGEAAAASDADGTSTRAGLTPLSKDERLTACMALALRLWAATSLTIGENELAAEVAATLTNLAELGYTKDQATHAIASGSLLVRTEEGAFAFIHQSVMEWLVAAAAARDPDSGVLTARRMSRLMTGFFADLCEQPGEWAHRTLRDQDRPESAKQNALDVALHLLRQHGARVGPHVRQELNLAGIDLRGLDLTDVNLTGANLTGATLRGMRLSGTNLTDADLTDADLTGARLTGGSLRGATLTGSRWDRAALLGTEGVPEMAAEELVGAAITGRDRADLMLRPGSQPNCMAMSPDGTLLVVGTPYSAEIIDVASAQVLRILRRHARAVVGVAFSPDGHLIATASFDHTARTWDTTTGQQRHTLTGHQEFVDAVAFSPDGHLIATASSDGTARTWDTTTGQQRHTLTGHQSNV